MQYAVFSDIHGNFAALKKVWEEITQAGLSEWPALNAGDNVGYGDAPVACLRFLQARPNILTVKGNYDKNVACFPEKEIEYRKKWLKTRPEKFEALRRDSARISGADRDWLLALPDERDITLDGARLILTHYSPGSRQGLGRWTGDEQLQQIAETSGAQVVVCGHTHSPFVRRVGGTLFVNPGTLGRTWFGGPSYAVLTLEPGTPPTARLYQVKK